MKTKQALAEKLKGLPELYEQARELFTYDKDKMLELGLITSKEKSILAGANHARSVADFAREEAEKAVPHPDIDSKLPPEYVELARQKRELYQIKQLNDAVDRTLRYISSGRQMWTDVAVGQALGLQHTAEKVFQQFRDLPDPTTAKYYTLEKRLENEERQGTRVQKTRHEVFGDYQAREAKAGAKAKAKTLDEHKAIFEMEAHLKVDIEQRRKQKLQPIKVKIEALLKSD